MSIITEVYNIITKILIALGKKKNLKAQGHGNQVRSRRSTWWLSTCGGI